MKIQRTALPLGLALAMALSFGACKKESAEPAADEIAPMTTEQMTTEPAFPETTGQSDLSPVAAENTDH
jgi:hypothetical protein